MENEIPMYVLCNKVTIKQLKKEDLCIQDFRKNLLYDYSTLKYFYSSILDELNDNTYKEFMEKSKHIKVFTKYQIKINSVSIKECINEWYYHQGNNIEFDYEVNLTDKAKKLLDKLAKEIHQNNKRYEVNYFVGYIDLSRELKKYIGRINDNK